MPVCTDGHDSSKCPTFVNVTGQFECQKECAAKYINMTFGNGVTKRQCVDECPSGWPFISSSDSKECTQYCPEGLVQDGKCVTACSSGYIQLSNMTCVQGNCAQDAGHGLRNEKSCVASCKALDKFVTEVE